MIYVKTNSVYSREQAEDDIYSPPPFHDIPPPPPHWFEAEVRPVGECPQTRTAGSLSASHYTDTHYQTKHAVHTPVLLTSSEPCV